MSTPLFDEEYELTAHEAANLEVLVGKCFQPRTPITTRELFAGRWPEITKLGDVITQPGLHAIIYGDRGVGKTSLANVIGPVAQYVFDNTPTDEDPKRLVAKVNAESKDTFSTIWMKLFDEIVWEEERAHFGLKRGFSLEKRSMADVFGLRDTTLNVNNIRHMLAEMPGAVFIIDEFDRAVRACSPEFTDLIKSLSDFSLDCTVILAGVSHTVDALVADHASIGRSLVQIHLPRMTREELKEILSKAQATLRINISSAAENTILHVSQGFPHYTHLLGREAVRAAARRRSRSVERQDVIVALKDAVKQSQQSVTDMFLKATHSSQQHSLFKEVLLACAITAATNVDRLGYFHAAAVTKPLKRVAGKSIPVTTFNKHLKVFSEARRGNVLERTGQEKAYRYRFRDPLLVPFVFMDAVSTGEVVDDDLLKMLSEF